MAFKVGFVVRAPGGNPADEKSFLKTDKIEVTTVVVELENPKQMVEICKNLVYRDGIQALVLCPAVSNDVVAKISNEIGDRAALFVARGDFGSVHLASEITEKEWFS
jgi:hypothetical protein